MQTRTFIAALGLAYAGLLAIGLRVERPEFRPWELLARKDGLGFTPSQRIAMEEVGDLGYGTWVRALQAPRPTISTTDAAGYRNATARDWAPIVVLGDSFVVGSGVSDDETLPARLEARLGTPVYNFGIPKSTVPSRYFADRRFVAKPAEVVVFAPVQRLLKPGAFTAAIEGAAVADDAIADEVRAALTTVERDNGLARLARFTVQGLRYRLLGEVTHHRVVTVDGAPAVVATLETLLLDRAPKPVNVDAYLTSLARFAEALAGRGTRLVFAPLPDQALVYPELYAPQAIAEPTAYDQLLAGAARAGLTVVDVRAHLAAHRTPYLYLRDDTHLAPHGLDRAAEAIAAALAPPP